MEAVKPFEFHLVTRLSCTVEEGVAHVGAALADLTRRIEHSVEQAGLVAGLAEEAAALRDAWSRVLRVTTSLRAIPDATLRLANAACYLDAFGHVVVAWLWLDQATAVTRATREPAARRTDVARRW